MNPDEDEQTKKNVEENSSSQIIDEFEIDNETSASNKRPKYAADYVNNDDFKVIDCTEINFENKKKVCLKH
jgi:hypothetical protein